MKNTPYIICGVDFWSINTLSNQLKYSTRKLVHLIRNLQKMDDVNKLILQLIRIICEIIYLIGVAVSLKSLFQNKIIPIEKKPQLLIGYNPS